MKKSGFDGYMSFIDPATRRNEWKRIRKNIIWFNPPFDKNVTTIEVKRFLQLIDKHFPKCHALHKLFNRNTANVSYSCMNNMASIISGHNAKILNSNTEVNNGGKECNCRKRDECPLNGACLTESIIYKAFVSAKNLPTKYYYEVTEGDFKTRWGNNKTSFTNANYKNVTELSHDEKETACTSPESISRLDIIVIWYIQFMHIRYHVILKICKHIFQYYCNWNIVCIAVAMRCQGIHLKNAIYIYNLLHI